jgi:CBS domain containing-hemolysin-like protein
MAMSDPGNGHDAAKTEEEKPEAPVSPSLLSSMGARLAKLVRELRGNDDAMRESIEEVIEESERETDHLSSAERMMLGNLLKFGELKVGDVMVPRADIVAVEVETPLPDLIKLFREAQHSRLPLYRETLDDPLGMIHVKDVLSLVQIDADGEMHWPAAPIAKLKRDILFVPAAMPGLDLLLKMQSTRIHLALVIDEYGGTDGLVSIEDLVEEIVGDIDDEYDVGDDLDIVARGDGFDADARLDLEEFHTRTGIDLAPAVSEEEVDSLGGLVSSVAGRVPARGEIVALPGYEVEILEADPRRVKRLRIRKLAAPFTPG